MAMEVDFGGDFVSFRREMCPVEGDYGPEPLMPDWLERWYRTAFDEDGDPTARNIMDCRTKKEGKSADGAAVALYMAIREPYSEVVIAAADKDQAQDRILRAAKFAVENGPLARHARVLKDTIEFDNRSTIQALPYDWQGAAGGNYKAVLFDELHAWIHEGQRRMFDELIIPPSVKHGVRWIASYAGYLGESELLKEWWDLGLAGDRLDEELPFYRHAEANLLAFIDTGPESWRMPWVTDDFIAETERTERANTFARLWLNEWRANEAQFVSAEEWEACRSDDAYPLLPDDNRSLDFAADASTSRDITALIGVEMDDETKKVNVAYVRTWKPTRSELRGGKPTVDLAELDREVRRLHKNGNLGSIAYDPYQLHSLAVEWEKDGIPVSEMPQTAQRTEADQALYDAIIGQRIGHYGEKTLTQHVLAAVGRDTPRGLRLDKEKTSRKIDAAVALSMAHYSAREQINRLPAMVF